MMKSAALFALFSVCAASGHHTWTECADENARNDYTGTSTCNCAGPGARAILGYHGEVGLYAQEGGPAVWSGYKDVTGSIGCSNGVFGGDPISGTYKSCYCQTLAEQCLFQKDSGGAMVAWESGPVREIVDVGRGCCRFAGANRVADWEDTVSKGSCASQCRANAECMAFEWHSKTRHCEHHNVSPSEGSDGFDGSAHCAGVKCYSKSCDEDSVPEDLAWTGLAFVLSRA